MVTLNDYLYSGDTVFKIIQNYMTDLRKEAKRTHNEIDLVHSNCLLQVQEMLEHNDFLTSQSQKIREFYKYMAKEFPFLAFTFRGRIKSLIRTEEKFNGYIVEYIYNYSAAWTAVVGRAVKTVARVRTPVSNRFNILFIF